MCAKVIAAIRTHRWDEDALRLAAQLRPVFADNLVTVFHDRPTGTDPGIPVIDLNTRWLRRNGLKAVPDWGWRCGDYFAYALRAARPDADAYWLIEPDVWFAGDAGAFFAQANDLKGDLLGPKVEPLGADHRFAKGLSGPAPHRAIFALTRFSGAALDHLFAARKAYSAQGIGPRLFTNDEVFCYSTLAADPAFAVGSLADALPDWFPPGSMRTDPDILIDALRDAPMGVYHPVRARQSFKRAVASRLANNGAFLKAMSGSLALMSDDDIRDIANDLGARTALALRAISSTETNSARTPEESSS